MGYFSSIAEGSPSPFGLSISQNDCNFALYGKNFTSISLCLFDRRSGSQVEEIPLIPKRNRTANVWHVQLRDLTQRDQLLYAFRINGLYILDPYAKEVVWKTVGDDRFPLGGLYCESPFSWENDKPLELPLDEVIIYEMHVKDFTEDPSSQTLHKGTFLGVIEKIPYLVELGITAVELLPVFSFNPLENKNINPFTHEPLINHWGYSTVNFFSLADRYVFGSDAGAGPREFKEMVKALHKNNIEVYLDVVFNHTAEGGLQGPTYSFKGIDPHTYYMMDHQGHYLDYTGCGNTVNCNHPVVIEFIRNCLHYWVREMHVDGFRFDLASAMTRSRNGFPLAFPPVIDALSQDPLLAKTKLIAEAWDAAGLYQVGGFYPEEDRWREWNGKYRDSLRRFIKGTLGEKREFSTRLCGSQDLYGSGRSPLTSVNFITSHDGFSLADLVSYEIKHNEANGEENRDGNNHNDSCNYGIEGASTDPAIIALRQRQMKNFHLALMVSQGIPMIYMGDEYGHSKNGNNNTWCQDNELNRVLWNRLESNPFFEFTQKLIAFRKAHRILRRDIFLQAKDIHWHGLKPFDPEWDWNNNFLAFTLIDNDHNRDLYIAFNMANKSQKVVIPNPHPSTEWYWIINTALESPHDFVDQPKEYQLHSPLIDMPPHSAFLLEAF